MKPCLYPEEPTIVLCRQIASSEEISGQPRLAVNGILKLGFGTKESLEDCIANQRKECERYDYYWWEVYGKYIGGKLSCGGHPDQGEQGTPVEVILLTGEWKFLYFL